MSANFSVSAIPPLPPPGLNYVAVIEPALVFCLLGAYFSGALVPLLIFLFMFSSVAARRHPVFLLNVFIIILGLVLGAVNVGQEWSNIVTPLNPIPDPLTLANIAITTMSPMIIDSVLIFRLIAFYPRQTTGIRTYITVLTFPVLVKCGRFISVTLFLYHLGQVDGHGSITLLAAQSWPRNRFLMSEWILQMADNLYSSTFFFWKLRKFYRGSGNTFLVRNKSLVSRLRGLFAIALANFVFPLFLNVTQIVLIARDPSYARGAEVLMANMYISIIGVLFATVWASGNAWGRNHSPCDQSALETTFSEMPGYVSAARRASLGGKGSRPSSTTVRAGTTLNGSASKPSMNSAHEQLRCKMPNPIQVQIEQEAEEFEESKYDVEMAVLPSPRAM